VAEKSSPSDFFAISHKWPSNVLACHNKIFNIYSVIAYKFTSCVTFQLLGNSSTAIVLLITRKLLSELLLCHVMPLTTLAAVI